MSNSEVITNLSLIHHRLGQLEGMMFSMKDTIDRELGTDYLGPELRKMLPQALDGISTLCTRSVQVLSRQEEGSFVIEGREDG